jgi:hypothetical protein
MYLLAGLATLLDGVYLVFRQGREDDPQAVVAAGDPT